MDGLRDVKDVHFIAQDGTKADRMDAMNGGSAGGRYTSGGALVHTRLRCHRANTTGADEVGETRVDAECQQLRC